MSERNDKGQFVTGHNGGPGRPQGARNKLGEAFIADFYADWQEHGKDAITAMRAEKPHEYVKVAASLLPKELNVKIDPIDEMTDADLDRAIRQFAAIVGLEIGAHAPLAGEGEADNEGQALN